MTSSDQHGHCQCRVLRHPSPYKHDDILYILIQSTDTVVAVVAVVAVVVVE
jgi:hypothetical protein